MFSLSLVVNEKKKSERDRLKINHHIRNAAGDLLCLLLLLRLLLSMLKKIITLWIG
jgi:hypothetical protein